MPSYNWIGKHVQILLSLSYYSKRVSLSVPLNPPKAIIPFLALKHIKDYLAVLMGAISSHSPVEMLNLSQEAYTSCC